MREAERRSRYRAIAAAFLAYVLVFHAGLSAQSLVPTELDLRPDLAALYSVCASDSTGSSGPELPDHGSRHLLCALCALGHCSAPIPSMAEILQRPGSVHVEIAAPLEVTLVVPRRAPGAARPRGPPAFA